MFRQSCMKTNALIVIQIASKAFPLWAVFFHAGRPVPNLYKVSSHESEIRLALGSSPTNLTQCAWGVSPAQSCSAQGAQKPAQHLAAATNGVLVWRDAAHAQCDT